MRESEGEQSRSERWKIKGRGAFYPRVEEVWITSSPKVFRISHVGFLMLIFTCAKLTLCSLLRFAKNHNFSHHTGLSSVEAKLSPTRPVVVFVVVAVPAPRT